MTLEDGWSPAEADHTSPAMGMEEREKYEAILTKLKDLPELQQTVVKRAYLGGQTLKQIGTELGIPLGTIKSALSRALVRLRELNTTGEAHT